MQGDVSVSDLQHLLKSQKELLAKIESSQSTSKGKRRPSEVEAELLQVQTIVEKQRELYSKIMTGNSGRRPAGLPSSTLKNTEKQFAKGMRAADVFGKQLRSNNTSNSNLPVLRFNSPRFRPSSPLQHVSPHFYQQSPPPIQHLSPTRPYSNNQFLNSTDSFLSNTFLSQLLPTEIQSQPQINLTSPSYPLPNVLSPPQIANPYFNPSHQFGKAQQERQPQEQALGDVYELYSKTMSLGTIGRLLMNLGQALVSLEQFHPPAPPDTIEKLADTVTSKVLAALTPNSRIGMEFENFNVNSNFLPQDQFNSTGFQRSKFAFNRDHTNYNYFEDDRSGNTNQFTAYPPSSLARPKSPIAQAAAAAAATNNYLEMVQFHQLQQIDQINKNFANKLHPSTVFDALHEVKTIVDAIQALNKVAHVRNDGLNENRANNIPQANQVRIITNVPANSRSNEDTTPPPSKPPRAPVTERSPPESMAPSSLLQGSLAWKPQGNDLPDLVQVGLEYAEASTILDKGGIVNVEGRQVYMKARPDMEATVTFWEKGTSLKEAHDWAATFPQLTDAYWDGDEILLRIAPPGIDLDTASVVSSDIVTVELKESPVMFLALLSFVDALTKQTNSSLK